MSEWTIWSKDENYPLSKIAYVSRDTGHLLWCTCDLGKVRYFNSEEEAVKWLDKKWLKYGDKVNAFEPVKTKVLFKRWDLK